MSQSLAGMDWDDNIREENQEMWKAQLSRLVDFPTLLIPRICIPADNESLSGIRLICVLMLQLMLAEPQYMLAED